MPTDSGGNYTLPAGNPVAGGTTIDVSWANPTMDDIATGLTNRLSRNGNGGMLAGLPGFAGTKALPGYAFSGELGSGLYLAATNDIRLAIAGADTLRAVDDTATSSGYQHPLQYWDGAAWVSIGGTDPSVEDAATNTVTNVMTLTHLTTDTPAAGFGTGLAFVAETAAANYETGMVLEAVTTDVSAGSEDFDFVVKLMAAGAAAAEVFRVTSAGVVNLTSLNVGTLALAAGSITDSSGAISFGDENLSTTGNFTVNGEAGISDLSAFAYSSSQSHYGHLALGHSLSDTVGGHTALTVNDNMGLIAFQGSDGSSFYTGAYVLATATENFVTGTDGGTELSFWTTPDNSQTITQVLVLGQDQSATFAGQGVFASLLDIEGANTGSNTNVNIFTLKDLDTSTTTGQISGRVNFEVSDVGNEGIHASIYSVSSGSGGAGEIVLATGQAGTVTEGARLDDSQNFLVGKSATTFSVAGVFLNPAGILSATRASGAAQELNRTGTDGNIAEYYHAGALVGSLGSNSTEFLISSTGGDIVFQEATTERGRFTSGNLQLQGALVFAGSNPSIVGNDANGSLAITADTTTSLGFNTIYYGASAGNGGDALFRHNSDTLLLWDESDDRWEFSKNVLMNSGTDITLESQSVNSTRSKFWANYNQVGSTAIQDSYNVTSVTDNGTGDCTVTIATDFGDADWAAGMSSPAFLTYVSSKAAGSIRVLTATLVPAVADVDDVSVIGHGNQ